MDAWIEHLRWFTNEWAWGPPMLALLLGVGVFLMVGLRGMPIVALPAAFRLLWQGRHSQGSGEVPPFQALMTSLSATIGTGNISGVATAIYLGGPGALFWMWMTALVGMATKYAEAVCAVHFRERDENGRFCGGPMYYIRNGLRQRLGIGALWLAALFALFGMLAGFGIGNTVQANSLAHALHSTWGIAPYWSALVLMLLVAAVVLGGLRRIASVATWLVPMMALGYLCAGMLVLLLNSAAVPAALRLIIESAFTGDAAMGGAAGAAIWAAIRYGVARGVFSNEAGLGSAPISHAAAQTHSPVEQGMVAMLGTFLDTIVICSVTGLVIVVTGAWQSGETGAALSALAFGQALTGGDILVAVAQVLFAFTTMLGWCYYSERCCCYLFGAKAERWFRWLWVIAVPCGALLQLELVWLLADLLNALMALPNLIALLLLAPVIFRLTRQYRGEPRVVSLATDADGA